MSVSKKNSKRSFYCKKCGLKVQTTDRKSKLCFDCHAKLISMGETWEEFEERSNRTGTCKICGETQNLPYRIALCHDCYIRSCKKGRKWTERKMRERRNTITKSQNPAG